MTNRAGALAVRRSSSRKGARWLSAKVCQAVGGDVPVSPEPAHVVDQHVQPLIGLKHLCGQTAHPGLHGHARGKGGHGWAARCGADAGCGCPGTGLIAAGDTDPGAQRGPVAVQNGVCGSLMIRPRPPNQRPGVFAFGTRVPLRVSARRQCGSRWLATLSRMTL